MDFTSSKEIRSAGKALTAIGVIAHAASIPLASISTFVDHPERPGESNPMVAAGAALTAVSAVSVAIGAGLWGASNGFDRAERKLSLAPTGLAVRF